MEGVSMVSRLREVILPLSTDEEMSGAPGTMSSIVSNLPKMSETEVTLLTWG